MKDNTAILFKIPFGSALYGTQTPESDLDFRGIYLPTRRQAFLNRIPANVGRKRAKAAGEKNLPGELDEEYSSLHEFLRLALEGQTVALDMLHAHPSVWLISSGAWDELVKNRHRFYTKNLQAFVGYARRQAAKYGVKGSRLATGKAVLAFLESKPGMTIRDAFKGYPEILLHEHVKATGDETAPYEILGKRLTPGATTDHYRATFQHYVSAYGERARMAERNEGVDWKAVSHAMRAALEVELILLGREWSLPFDAETADYLRRIKTGAFTFVEVQEVLENRIATVEELALNSDLPEKADKVWADDFLVATMEEWAR